MPRKSLYDLIESVYLYVYLNDEMKYKILPHCGWVKQSKLYYINTSITLKLIPFPVLLAIF